MILRLATLLGAAAVAVVSALVYARAAREEPSPRFGFRSAAALASRRVWARVNRLSGLLGMAVSALVALLSLVLDELTLFLVFAASLLLLEGSLALYSRAILERETGLEPGGGRPVRRLPTIPADARPLAAALAGELLTVSLLVLSRPLLPERVAVHFDASGRPDFFMGREEFLVSFSALTCAVVAGLSLLMASCWGVPLVPRAAAYQRGLERVLKRALLAVSVAFPGVAALIVGYNAWGLSGQAVAVSAAALVVTVLALLLPPVLERGEG